MSAPRATQPPKPLAIDSLPPIPRKKPEVLASSSQDLLKAQATIGLCMTMCPEQEMKDRTDRKMLDPFEMLPGTEDLAVPRTDHTLCVKEFKKMGNYHSVLVIPLILESSCSLMTYSDQMLIFRMMILAQKFDLLKC